MFEFQDLCGRPVAAADYIALCNEFHTIAVSNVPVFNAANRATAYRFVTLVDVMYEHRWELGSAAAASRHAMTATLLGAGRLQPHVLVTSLPCTRCRA
jgi:predicted ATPase